MSRVAQTMLPVAWIEGLLLEPQHFQQQERYLEWHAQAMRHQLLAHAWGLSRLELDMPLLEQGIVRVIRAVGMFPDGTPFQLPDQGPLPPAWHAEGSVDGIEICLALSARAADRAQTDVSGVLSHARHDVIEAELVDTANADDQGLPRMARVQLARIRTRLVPHSAVGGDDTALPVLRLAGRDPAGRLQPDPAFLPPMLDASAVGWIPDLLRELRGMIDLRLAALSGSSQTSRGGGLSEWLEILLRQALAEYRLMLHHLAHRWPLHPETVWMTLLALLGRLAGLRHEAGGDLPALYDHRNPGPGFGQLGQQLREALSLVIDSPAVPLRFVDRGDRVRICPREGQVPLLRVVFAVMSDMPADELRARFVEQAKFAPVERIVQLVDLQLSGMRLQPLPAAPRHVPWYPGALYLDVGSDHPIWSELMASAAMALAVVGEFPGLRIEAWGLRDTGRPA
ncbi:MAG TPA: type VI secretion system baseplate subunit TssK [Dyella sp.]|uniref:type VI secretion system baseplate subunit TssK n=1 Tax=Dyella sp. TaxID=1869338 RepID=UPI002F94963D